MVSRLHTSVKDKATVVLIVIAVILALSAAMLHVFANKTLAKSILKSNRAVVVDLGKETIVVGSLHNSSKKRIKIEKENLNSNTNDQPNFLGADE